MPLGFTVSKHAAITQRAKTAPPPPPLPVSKSSCQANVKGLMEAVQSESGGDQDRRVPAE